MNDIQNTIGFYQAKLQNLASSSGNEAQVAALQKIIQAVSTVSSAEEFKQLLEGGLQLELDKAGVVDMHRALAKAAREFEEIPTAEMHEAVVEFALTASSSEELNQGVERIMEEKGQAVRADSRAKFLFMAVLNTLMDIEISYPGSEKKSSRTQECRSLLQELESLGHSWPDMFSVTRFRELQPFDDRRIEMAKELYQKFQQGAL